MHKYLHRSERNQWGKFRVHWLSPPTAMAIASTSILSPSHCFSSPLPYLSSTSNFSKARRKNKTMVTVGRAPSAAVVAVQARTRFRQGGIGDGSNREKDEQIERERKRKEEANRNIASKKAISIILRREATKDAIETKQKKGRLNSTKIHPQSILEALHDRITALRWESALKVFDLLREQLWYVPTPGIYIKLVVMLGKCKQPERAHELFQAMVDEGCQINHESYTALVSAYSRSRLFDKAFELLEKMKTTDGCHPDVQTYSIIIKSCLHYLEFGRVQILLSDMDNLGIKPNTVTYNTLIASYGRTGRFLEMESKLMEMLGNRDCMPDIWTMNATLRAFGASGQIEMMEKCYDKFKRSGICPDIKTFNILLDCYGKAKQYEKMSAVMEYMHKYYYSWTLVTYNVVIDAFGRAGDLQQMEYVFRLMKSRGIKPDRVTLCSLVRAYGRAEDVDDKIKEVLRYIENSDVVLDTIFFNSLVDAYGRAGRLTEMREVLEVMKSRRCRPNKVTYNAMIRAYLSRGIKDDRVKELQAIRREVSLAERES